MTDPLSIVRGLRRNACTPLLCSLLLMPAAFAQTPANTSTSPVKVEVVQLPNGSYQLQRNGEHYHVRGAGGPSRYQELADFGGNSTRTWGISQLQSKDENGKNLLDHAHDAGVSVVAGIWVQHVRNGFDYRDPASLEKQREHVRAAVREFRHHPAILIWGLGNEVEITTPGDDPAVWNELNELAKIVKEEDPTRPVMTIIAGTRESKVKGIMDHYPEIDILGVNAYGSARHVPQRLKRIGWTGPYMVTEFGPAGHWEVTKTDWGAPLEPTAEEKAKLYHDTYVALEKNTDGNYLGGYAFLWGHRQEVTPTWFSMFLETGERTPAADAMGRAWTGKWPANRAPIIDSWSVPFGTIRSAPGATFTASVQATSPNGGDLAYEWWILPERQGPSVGGDRERWLTRVEGFIAQPDSPSTTVTMPDKPGPYRLYLKVSNAHGAANTRNIPFYVQAEN